jgi:hypothetical protein
MAVYVGEDLNRSITRFLRNRFVLYAFTASLIQLLPLTAGAKGGPTISVGPPNGSASTSPTNRTGQG